MHFADNVRYLRKLNGISQSKLAEILGYKSFTTVQKWEDGTSEPPIEVAKAMAQLFKVNLGALATDDLEKDTYIDKDGIRRYKGSDFPVLKDKPEPVGTAAEKDFYKKKNAYLEKLVMDKAYVSIPVLGQVAAGIPIEMIEDIIDYEDIPAEMAKDGTYFGLQIKGDSMEPRIYDGDVVIVKKQDYCDNNDIAIVTVNGYDATCKRILKSEGGITLMPLNTRHTPQMFTNEQIENIPVRIIGLVVEVRGKLKF